MPALVYTGLTASMVASLGAPLVPDVATEYGVSLSLGQWSLTIALMVSGLSAPILGRFSDSFDRRRVLLVALAVVTAGCDA